jgi:hypothetical protein
LKTLERGRAGKARNLALLAAAQVLVLAVWFAGTAVLPALLREGDVGGSRGGLLTTAVQLGFVAGTLISAILTLADRIPPRRLFFGCAILAGLATMAMAAVPPAGAAALALRFLAGAAIAGVYPIGMKLAAGWARGDLGLMIGLLVGALTIGSALDNDVVLISDNLVPHHARVAISDAWRGMIRIEAKSAAIRALDGRIVEQGRYLDLAMPACFQAGGAEFRVSQLHDLSRARRFALPVVVLAALALLLPSITGAVTGLFRSPATTIAGLEQPALPAIPGADQLEKWQEMLRARLRETGLTGQVSIERGGSGNLVATGSVEPANTEKWRDVIKWFDAQAGAPLLLNNVARGEQNAVLPAIRAVWLDASRTSPYKLYQFFVNTEDAKVCEYLRKFTFLTRAEIEPLEAAHAANPGAREAHRALAASDSPEVGAAAGVPCGSSSEERRVGKECNGRCRSRWSPDH